MTDKILNWAFRVLCVATIVLVAAFAWVIIDGAKTRTAHAQTVNACKAEQYDTFKYLHSPLLHAQRIEFACIQAMPNVKDYPWQKIEQQCVVQMEDCGK
jgi:hypothetical protein